MKTLNLAVKEFIERVKSTTALFYGMDLDKESIYYLEKHANNYFNHNGKIELLGVVLIITPDDEKNLPFLP
ncbi:hypothetical protein JCM14244_16580 [Venenivibrio stagnispumantis]|uniref:Uncharacterized protein n=1 Tax=Venenivibrio stagnispumantis TaxID=407998 RepID=A0AA46AFQ6_9AQUI|nr:hypothetical protein [Venenivibrio stagnispumantis]MCW4573987.1 hypothetical protein [Venenivibrio stagnispumantis]SMP21087.1 hypothetical protein SAMN06264868_1224 [Venenivibrio stagnispumantis]